jgi:hypothetical protein
MRILRSAPTSSLVQFPAGAIFVTSPRDPLHAAVANALTELDGLTRALEIFQRQPIADAMRTDIVDPLRLALRGEGNTSRDEMQALAAFAQSNGSRDGRFLRIAEILRSLT